MPRKRYWKRGLAKKKSLSIQSAKEECYLAENSSQNASASQSNASASQSNASASQNNASASQNNASASQTVKLNASASNTVESNALASQSMEFTASQTLKSKASTSQNREIKSAAPENVDTKPLTSHAMPVNTSTPEKVMDINLSLLENNWVQGTFHQGHSKFLANSGRQCVANSCASIAYGQIKNILSWESADLDLILTRGNELYSFVRNTLQTPEIYLLISELPHLVNLYDRSFTLTRGESLTGLFSTVDSQECDFVMSLHSALKKALHCYDSCFINFGRSTFAVIKRNNRFCVFDSHSRNSTGLQDVNGKALLVKYSSDGEVFSHCKRLAESMGLNNDTQFEITGVNITVQEPPIIGPMNSPQSTNDTADIIVVDSRSNPYSFCPLTLQQRESLCSRLRLSDVNLTTVLQQKSVNVMGNPSQTSPIGMDGNCFFRALSFAISGVETNHRKVRLAVVKHLKQNAEIFTAYLRPHFLSMDDYIQSSRMSYVKSWATEVEILAASDLLETDIYTYSTSWLKYSRSQFRNTGESSNLGIYLKHCAESHYEVVTSVTRKRNHTSNGATPEIVSPAKRISVETLQISNNIFETDLLLKHTRDEQVNQGVVVRSVREMQDEPQTKESRFVERYKLDEHYRQQMKAKSKLRYAQNALYREKAKGYIRQKYKSDSDYQAKMKANSRQKYKSDSDYQIKKKAYSKEKYQHSVNHQAKLKAYSRQKYKADSDYQAKLKANSRQKYKADSDHQRKKKAYSKEKYRNNVYYQEKLKANSRQKYKADSDHQRKKKAYSKEKYRNNVYYQEKLKAYSRQKYEHDAVHKKKKKDCSTYKYKHDASHKASVKAASIKKYKHDDRHRKHAIKYNKSKYADEPGYSAKVKQRNSVKRTQQKLDRRVLNRVITNFKQMVLQCPDHICAVCHRRLFSKQVMSCNPHSYSLKNSNVKAMAAICITRKYLHQCSRQCHPACAFKNSPASKLWICYTCHRKIMSGQMPQEAAANNLHLQPIPQELQCLNSLEEHLISKHIPFAKISSLPKNGQKGIYGPVVCVPSNIEKTVSSLPRCEAEDQIQRIQLKRKLTYKGHYEDKFVNISDIKKALTYLKANNKYYKDIEFNQNWMRDIEEDAINSKTVLSEKEDDTLPDLDTHEGTDAPGEESHTGDNGLYTDSCLQPVDLGQEILDQHLDKILCLAPAEGNDPIKILMDGSNEAKSFPVAFPSGQPTYHDDRDAKITLARYLHTRLMLADSRFARNTNYIFYAQYLSEVSQVLSSVSIALRKSFVNTVGGKVSAERLTNNESLQGILKCDDGFKFLKCIRGTPAFWQSAQKDLFAMLRQLGIPTWFCSFSAGDMRWSEIIEALLKEEGDLRTIDELDWNDKSGLLRRNPVTAARMFDHRFHCFLKDVIMSPANPIGKIEDYFYRVEFQQRGSPHTHCLFWVKDAPQMERDTDEDVASFIDKYITCEVPPPSDAELHDIVTTVQKHSTRHSNSCRKKGTKCRFNFPRPPSNRTFICRPAESKTNSEANGSKKDDGPSKNDAITILKNLWAMLENPEQCFDTVYDLFCAVGIDQELFEQAFKKLSTKANIVLKRNNNDVWINQYNSDLLRCWNANMDIQYVVDAYSCIVYIISYISKSEREMGLLLDHTRKEALDGNESAKQAMKKMGGVYLHSREVSAQEAVYRVCTLPLKECSRKVQFIPTGDNIVKMSLPLSVLKRKSEGKDLDSADMWMTNITDRYRNRPSTLEFESMCLACFCSEFRIVSKSEVSRVKSENRRSPVHQLQNDLGFIQKRSRTKPAVIRYARFSPEKQPEKYHQAMLQLFLPHRSDGDLKPESVQSFGNFYQTGFVKLDDRVQYVRNIVEDNKALFEKDAEQIEQAEDILETCGSLENAWAQICPETEVERLSCLDQRTTKITDPSDKNDIPDLLVNDKKDYTIQLQQNVISHNEAQSLLRSLNVKQQEVFYKVRQWCLNKSNGKAVDSFFLFVSGGAGTGKSHTIKCIHYEATRLLRRVMQNPDDISVVLTAPTGVAAFNINAATIHTTFSIGVDVKLPYTPLGEEKVNTLRSKLGGLEILIIDEISMVDHKLLTYVHGRLRQIKQCKDYSPFGNVSVIAVGDFYQLPPVKGKALYTENVGVDLWSDNFRMVELTQIMRQKNATFAGILNRLRTKSKSEVIQNEDKVALTERETGEESDAIHIFATNDQVDSYNIEKLHAVCSDHISVDAEDFYKNEKSGKLEKKESHFIKVYNTNLPRRVTLGEGARVMLTKNLDVSDGFVNGVFGTVSSIPVESDGTVPSTIFVVFDNSKVGQKLRAKTAIPSSVPSNSTPITQQEDRVNSSGGIRRQFPVKLSFACTVHKLQGSTLDKAVVSLDKIFSAGQAYVALSRATSLDQLIINDFKESAIYCNEKVTSAMSNMLPFMLAEQETDTGFNFKIIVHNVQGLKTHLLDIQSDERFIDADLICLTETWLTKDETQGEPHLDGFEFVQRPRELCYDASSDVFYDLKHQAHGGVGVYYGLNVNIECLDLASTNLEYLPCRSIEHNMIVVIIYRPLSYSISLFRQKLICLLEELNTFSSGCILAGDFNDNILRSSTVMNVMQNYGFRQLVMEPTTEMDTLIDHVYVRRLDRVEVKILPTYFSHHEAISIKL